jgi:hypothetical protein
MSRATAPARKGHKAECEHRWCYCYDITHPQHPEVPCRICRIKTFNDNAVKQADPVIRHPEGM